MKLLKSITILTILCSTSLMQAQWGKWKKIKGSGNITTETFSTASYDGIKTAGAMDFNLIPGKEGQITVKADDNLMSYIVVEVKNETLSVRVKDGYNLKPSSTISVTIPFTSINAVSLAGSGNVKNSGTIESDDINISLAGSGDIELNIDTNETESHIAGSGDIKLEGSTTELTLKVTGSGNFEGDDLNSTNVTAKVTGSGGADVVCNGELIVRITGSGNVHYSGKPTQKDTKITGSGSINN
ncbi:DUF2807 domain-containing protein [Winogradskyella eckloniae]|uniref:head GIN domain-containing protein n=1 Tax=Winogradskyella eckloniae TaxID=1089306 RepID=UPI00156481E3|nr:head GIN domain-containing protein [Winogradskyella eckloniae]NRD20304.1 DUF2807 domain-containing protein [Winogradskyella eckloniae]